MKQILVVHHVSCGVYVLVLGTFRETQLTLSCHGLFKIKIRLCARYGLHELFNVLYLQCSSLAISPIHHDLAWCYPLYPSQEEIESNC